MPRDGSHDQCTITASANKKPVASERVDLTEMSPDSGDSPTVLQGEEDRRSEASDHIEPGPSKLQQAVQFARVLLRGSRAAEALDVLDAVSPTLSSDPTFLCLRGQCLAAEGSVHQALAAFNAALAAEPAHLDSLLSCAALHKAAGRLEQALEYLERAYEVVETPAHGDLPMRASLGLAAVLTDLATQQKLAGMAGWRGLYERAVKVCPSYAAAHYNLGVASGEAGDAAQALQHYTQAVQLDPGYAQAWCNLGVIHKAEVGGTRGCWWDGIAGGAAAKMYACKCYMRACMRMCIAGQLSLNRHQSPWTHGHTHTDTHTHVHTVFAGPRDGWEMLWLHTSAHWLPLPTWTPFTSTWQQHSLSWVPS
jgi:tetratricopeptide (TPR) repeat protein